MKGAIAADIIASPYRDNPLPDTGSIFFPLFTPSIRVSQDGSGRRTRSRIYHAEPGLMSSVALATARWKTETDESIASWKELYSSLPLGRLRSKSELLAACVPITELSGNLADAITSASAILRASDAGKELTEAASVFVRLLASVKDGASVDSLKDILRQSGYDPDRSPSEMRPFLNGTVIQIPGGKLGIGDGKPCSDPSQVIPAALAAFLASESYEEAVRRATAIGGDTCLTAFLASALAEVEFGIPEGIASEALDYLPDTDKDLIATLERRVQHISEEENASNKRNSAEEGKRFSVIRMDGRQSVYVIPEGADDIENAVKEVGRMTQKPFEIIRPEDQEETLKRLSLQVDEDGRLLDGTYAEHPRPEIKALWLQDGSIRTSTTRKGTDVAGRALPSQERRISNFNEFKKLRDYASGVRDELEQLCHADPPDGTHVHFASAFYPVVYERRIDLMQGDTLRGRVVLDNDGRIRVDTSAMTGGVHVEGLEGVLATMNLFRANDTPADIRLSLDRWCLDRGAIEDESERRALRDGDHDADGVRLKYASNIDTAISDLCGMEAEMAVAVIPDIAPQMAEHEMQREVRAEKSREKYAGLTHEEAVWSRSFPGSVFTIGHSNLPANEFEGLLRKFGIQLVVDVRSYPNSQFSPQYKAFRLEKRLEESLGIGYQQAGEALGGHQYEGKGDDRKRLSYEQIMHRPEFNRYMKALRECAQEGTRIALMCSESDPMDCHRFAMLGYALAHPSDGRTEPIDVQHITRKGYLLSQEFFENKLVRELGLSDKPDGLAEAMRIKGKALIERSKDSIGISLTRNMKNTKGRKR